MSMVVSSGNIIIFDVAERNTNPPAEALDIVSDIIAYHNSITVHSFMRNLDVLGSQFSGTFYLPLQGISGGI